MRFIVEQADPKDRLAIVTFNDSAMRVLPLKRMDREGKNAAIISTLRLMATGGTNIAAGLETALQVMEERRQRNPVSAVLLLTDGRDKVTRSRLPGLVVKASHLRCSIYTFGFGIDHDAALLAEVSEQAKTPFTFLENVSALQEAFAGVVGGLSSMVAQDVRLSLVAQVPIKTLHTPF